MPEWSRRDLIRASAGAAAVAVPMAALSSSPVGAVRAAAGASGHAEDAHLEELERVGHDPVMFCIHDAKLGDVSILHGENEVVVRDPKLVARIMRAARGSQAW